MVVPLAGAKVAENPAAVVAVKTMFDENAPTVVTVTVAVVGVFWCIDKGFGVAAMVIPDSVTVTCTTVCSTLPPALP